MAPVGRRGTASRWERRRASWRAASCSKLAIPGRSLELRTALTSASLLASNSHLPCSSPAQGHHGSLQGHELGSGLLQQIPHLAAVRRAECTPAS